MDSASLVQTTVTAASSGNRDAEGSNGELVNSELSKYSIIVLHKIRQIPETNTSVAV